MSVPRRVWRLVAAVIGVSVLTLGAWCAWCKSPFRFTRLVDGVQRGDIATVQRELDGGADPNRRTSVLGAENLTGFTSLMWAAYSRDAEVMHVLLEHGADIHAVEPQFNRTALHILFASPSDRSASSCIRLLIEHGLRWDTPMKWGGPTPLAMAITRGEASAVDAMLSAMEPGAGAARALREALLEALVNGDRAIVQCPIAHGASPTEVMDDGLTVLETGRMRGADPVLIEELKQPSSSDGG